MHPLICAKTRGNPLPNAPLQAPWLHATCAHVCGCAFVWGVWICVGLCMGVWLGLHVGGCMTSCLCLRAGIAHSTATQQQHRRTIQSAHSTQHSNTTTTQKNNTVRSSTTVTSEKQQTHEAQQAASKTAIPTQPKSRHYTHIMTISSNEHKRQTVTNYKQHKSIVPHDSTTGSHPSNHPHPPIAHSTATQQQHRRTTQSGHQQQSTVRSSRHRKHNKQQAKQRYQHSRKAGITHTS